MDGYKFVSGGADLPFGTFGPTRRERRFLKLRALVVDACRQIFSGCLVRLKPVEDRIAGGMV
jgi:hypothetical protein